MENELPQDISKAFEEALSETSEQRYTLCLYVAGQTPRSIRAITNLQKIVDAQLKGRCDVEIVDIYQEPDRIKQEQLIALPTLIKVLPDPLRRIIGDLSDTEKVLVGLNLTPKV